VYYIAQKKDEIAKKKLKPKTPNNIKMPKKSSKMSLSLISNTTGLKA
jgi:hypothetical protein